MAEKLINEQLSRKETMSSLISNYKKAGKDRRTETFYKSRLTQLQKIFDEFVENHQRILSKMREDNIDQKKYDYFTTDVFAEVDDLFTEALDRIQKRYNDEFKAVEEEKQNNSSYQLNETQFKSTQEVNLQLPKISLDKFNGDYKKWPTFFDLFNTLVNKNPSLANVQKLQYLKLHLTGEAENLIKHFNITECNYTAAWDSLVERYDNKRVLVHAHIKPLFAQAQAVETAESIKTMLDTTTENLQALANLGLSIENWDPMIIFMVVQKLPQETHQLWEQSRSTQKNLPTWKDLQTFLESRFRTLEAITIKKPIRGTTTVMHVGNKDNCVECNGPHHLRKCPKFLNLDQPQRYEIVKNKKLCINCINQGHRYDSCPSKSRCLTCKKPHHTLLHRTPVQQNSDHIQSKPGGQNAHTSNTYTTLSASAKEFRQSNLSKNFNINTNINQPILPTALIKVINSNSNESLICRALIDPCSQSTLISKAIVQQLKLRQKRANLQVFGAGGSSLGNLKAQVDLTITNVHENKIVHTTAFVIDKITQCLPETKFTMQNWAHIAGLELADPGCNKPSKIDVLLGAGIYNQILLEGVSLGATGTPAAQQTIFGWVLTGQVQHGPLQSTNIFHVSMNLDDSLKKFWEIEEVQEQRRYTEEEELCEKHFNETIKRLPSGRYEGKLPFRDKENTVLGNSRKMAVARLISIERQFLKNEKLKEDYSKCINDLSNHLMWWEGPKWLGKSPENWPLQKLIKSTEIELKKSACVHLSQNKEIQLIDYLETKYSSFQKLVRVVGYMFRFIHNSKPYSLKPTHNYLTCSEIDRATQALIAMIQSKYFAEEIKSIQQNKPFPKASKLLNLNPFLDKNMILRVGGRLRNSDLPYNQKFPIILPDKSWFVNLLIQKTHFESCHGGSQLIMNILASRYWIINARNTIRFIVHKCIPCYKQKTITSTQLMGDLPTSRVQMNRPFSHSGLDYCGPFELKTYKGKSSKRYKAYIAVFICMAVKAIHLELVTDLSSTGFIAAYRRFSSRRGKCSIIYCDNGTNFVGATKQLKTEHKQMMNQLNEEIQGFFENDGVQFKFIPPGAPHFGGLWEAGVRSTKMHLKKVLCDTILTYEELSTVLSQIEASLNSRPLCALSANADDFQALTPGHFLIGEAIIIPPEPIVLNLNVHRLDRWQFVQRLQQQFWSRWSTEYLNRLQQRPKWTQKQTNVKINQLVLLKDENLPPCRWLLCRIVDTHPGADGLTRVVTLKTKDGTLKRPITKICLLPIEDKDLEENQNDHSSTNSSTAANQRI